MQGSGMPDTSNDAVRLSKEQFCTTYEQAFGLWSSLHAAAAAAEHRGPPPFVDLRDALRAQPAFPRHLGITRETIANEGRICAHGYSTWGASALRCRRRRLPAFQLPPARIEVAFTSTATTTLVTEDPAAGLDGGWFRGSRNYIAILALAWSYILSARWAEVMPGPCTLAYCDEAVATGRAGTGPADHDAVVVDIGAARSDEARWWSALLAEDHGWRAAWHLDGETFVAPWSVRRRGSHRLVLAFRPAPSPRPLSASAPSCADARRFLSRFCARHGLAAQSHAALAAVLLFPSMGRGKTLRLPVSTAANTSAPARAAAQDAGSPDGAWDLQDRDLDRLIMLSCYTRGLRPMLLSVFYEPSVDCNAVSAWLQGTMAAIDRRARHAPFVLGRMLMDRSPNVSFLWLGATLLGLQETLLKEARRGQIPIDLHSAAWSRTTQTFLQLPTSRSPCGTRITRADECRLLFLGQSDGHSRLPVVQWRPFGTTQLDDVDLDVRAHAHCKHHQLQYQGFHWAVREDAGLRLRAEWLSGLWRRVRLRVASLCARPEKDPASGFSEVCISHQEMDRAKEGIAENATRNIFNWLRPNGQPQHEKNIWDHEWFANSDSEEEDEAEESDPAVMDRSSATALWISKLPRA